MKKPKTITSSSTMAKSTAFDPELCRIFKPDHEKASQSLPDAKIQEYLQMVRLKEDDVVPVKLDSKQKAGPIPIDVLEANSGRFTLNTIFIANVPLSCALHDSMKQKFIKQLATWMGGISQDDLIESVRFRCLPVLPSFAEEGKAPLPKRAAISKKLFNLSHQSIVAYVRLVENCRISLDEAIAAINGKIFQERHLRVDHASEHGSSGSKFDESRTLFIGNLPKNADEDALRAIFDANSCDSISRIRLIRDSKSQECRGVGYVEFKNCNAARFCLDLVSLAKKPLFILDGRPLRVSKCKTTALPDKSSRNTTLQPKGNQNHSHPPEKRTKQSVGATSSELSEKAKIMKQRHSPALAKSGLPNRAERRRLLFSHS